MAGQSCRKVAALRTGTTAGAQLWMANAPILRAIVEYRRTDLRLTDPWLEQMQTFTDAAIAQINVAGPTRPPTSLLYQRGQLEHVRPNRSRP
jgi:hypothetical protein